VTPIIKAFIHKYPNSEYRNTYSVSEFHFIVVKNFKSGFYAGVPTDMINAAITQYTAIQVITTTQAIGGTKNT